MARADSMELRIFYLGGCLVVVGAVLTALIFGLRHGVSFLAGGLLAAANLAVLRYTIKSAMLRGPGQSGLRLIASHIARLVLIPLCLYAMMHFLFLGIIAATIGFAVFSCGLFVEGIWEAFHRSAK